MSLLKKITSAVTEAIDDWSNEPDKAVGLVIGHMDRCFQKGIKDVKSYILERIDAMESHMIGIKDEFYTFKSQTNENIGGMKDRIAALEARADDLTSVDRGDFLELENRFDGHLNDIIGIKDDIVELNHWTQNYDRINLSGRFEQALDLMNRIDERLTRLQESTLKRFKSVKSHLDTTAKQIDVEGLSERLFKFLEVTNPRLQELEWKADIRGWIPVKKEIDERLTQLEAKTGIIDDEAELKRPY